jgi:hypothetical protein
MINGEAFRRATQPFAIPNKSILARSMRSILELDDLGD